MTPIERVARAIRELNECDDHGPGINCQCRKTARAALEAIEPSEKMLKDAGIVEGWGDDTVSPESADRTHIKWFKSMIDTALEQGT